MANEDTARTVIQLPESYRAALRTEAQERGCDMGDIVAEALEAYPSFMATVERIRKKRQTDRKKRPDQS